MRFGIPLMLRLSTILLAAWTCEALGENPKSDEKTPAQASETAGETKQPTNQTGTTKPKTEPADGQTKQPAAKKTDKAAAISSFLRVQRDKHDDPTSLQTSVVRYVSADPEKQGLVVDLIGAVHVADAQYYKKLNDRFKQYDALLYELVAEDGTRIKKGGKRDGPTHPIASLQLGMKSVLELSFQLEDVDYTCKNFVHADMSPDEFSKSMARKGESFLQIYLRLVGQGIAMKSKSGKNNDFDFLSAILSTNRALALKRALADQFAMMGGQLQAIEGKDGSTLVAERNKKALAVLAREIMAGKKKFGIFYGAAHMPDMEKRLLAEFGLKRESEEWYTAWDLTDKPAAK